jgi:hypothetical protein
MINDFPSLRENLREEKKTIRWQPVAIREPELNAVRNYSPAPHVSLAPFTAPRFPSPHLRGGNRSGEGLANKVCDMGVSRGLVGERGG